MTGASVEESDFGDSLLEQVARVPQPFKPLLGERLGGKDGRRFELLEQLGQGSMGLVYRARDEELQREVALKFLLPREEVARERMVMLLQREARAIAQLNHENIIRIFDVSEWKEGPREQPVPFLVMEYLHGESLEKLLRRERPALKRAVELIGGVAAGLAHAHHQHLIHRDLKPSNVFITSEGTVKLLDFGLSYVMAASSPAVPLLPTAGTPPYMAPEQWRGEPQDERTDIWALGVMLYELLTGAPPYPNTSLQELREQVTSEEPVPSVRQRHPALPEELERLVSSALAKRPERRIPSAQEFREELREVEERLGFRREAQRGTEPQRRHMTLVACRLVVMADQLDSEDFGELESAFLKSCSEIIQQHGGVITLALGDEVLACFGHPVAREEDSAHAGHAGLQLVRGVPEAIQRRFPRMASSKLAVTVGVHTDMVTVDRRSQGLQGSGLVIQGDAPKIASWLARQASPGTVVLSGKTWLLLRGAFETEKLDSRAFAGLTRTLSIDLHHLLRESKTAFRFDRALATHGLSRLVGRENELRRLLELWKQTRQGQGSFVLLSGEAGIGKSRLIQELRRRVSLESSPRLRCQCWPQSSASAFRPIIDMLQHLFQEELLDTAGPQGRMGALEKRLARLGLSEEHVQMLASLLSLPVPENLPFHQFSPERQKAMLFEALVDLLLRVTRAHPVLGVVEDLHWADPSTLELLGYVLEHTEGTRLLLLLSARPEFHPSWPQRPWFHRMTLERLSAESTETLIKEAAWARPLPEETVRLLVAKTDGIPLFVEEMTNMVLARGPTTGELPASIPESLHELLLARLDMLPSRQKALAQLCSVVGRSFTHALLEALTQRRGDSLRRDLEELVAAGLLERQEEHAEPGYQFRHGLIQDVACESLLRSTRRRYHLRIAQVLVEKFPEVAEMRPEVLAHHYTGAGEYALAIPQWTRAGMHASLHSANLEAISHLKQALKLLRGMPDAERRRGEELQLLITLGIPLVQVQGYHTPEVEQTYARARELFQEVGEALPQLELSYWGPFAYYFARTEYSMAQELGERLVDLGHRQHSRELLVLGYRMVASCLFIHGRMREARDYIERALACSDFTLEEHRALAVRHWLNPRVSALAYAAFVLSPLGEVELASRYSQEALELAEQIGHPHTLAFALNYLALACQLRRDAACALKWADQCIALSNEHRFRLWSAWSTLVRSWALSELGQPQEGMALMQQALAHWRASGIPAGMNYNLARLAELHLKLGQRWEALANVDEALKLVEQEREHYFDAELHRLRGEILQKLGWEEEGRECFLRALRIAREQGSLTYERHARESLERGHPGEWMSEQALQS
ncbi:protein kinase domain-containing protein [Archangium lansingense]|uniref:protein kinase domain-containing protein n=1 Tax=Archangium lansingense TaxID=2995310 RepID=UPI003B81DFFA